MPWLPRLTESLHAMAVPPATEWNERGTSPEADAFVDWLLDACTAEAADAGHLSAGLALHARVFRRGEVCAMHADGSPAMRYYPAKLIAQELVEISHACREHAELPPLLVAVGIFAHFLSIHPMSDGNGRAGRRLLAGLLRRFNLWGPTPLPLAFMMHRDRDRHVSVQRTLQQDHTWGVYLSYMASLLCAAAELSAVVHFRSSP